MSLSPKKPVQPWIPERKAAPAAQKRRVVAKAGLSADGAIKAGWWLCILSGLLIGVLATVAVATATMESEAGQIAGAVAITGGYYVALVLYSVGGLAHTVLYTSVSTEAMRLAAEVLPRMEDLLRGK